MIIWSYENFMRLLEWSWRHFSKLPELLVLHPAPLSITPSAFINHMWRYDWLAFHPFWADHTNSLCLLLVFTGFWDMFDCRQVKWVFGPLYPTNWVKGANDPSNGMYEIRNKRVNYEIRRETSKRVT
jgi:hypothetical protein